MTASSRPRRPGRPWGIVFLALWEVLVGIQMVLVGLALLSLSDMFDEGSGERAFLFFVGLGYVVIGVSALLLARGYVKGYESSRRRGRSVAMFAIVFAILALFFLPPNVGPDNPVWTIIFNIGILWYLGSEGVVAYFRSRSR